MPHLAYLAALLLSGSVDMTIDFKKASVCCISFLDEVRCGEGCLEWLLPPRHLRALAGDHVE